MGKLKMPLSDFAEIRRSAEIQDAINEVTAEIADEANASAGVEGGYEADMAVGSDRARGHVRAHTYEVKHVEAKSSPLMQAAARRGAQ
jgi:hypothetical protein